jgi:arylsulfatase A-like enzyme
MPLIWKIPGFTKSSVSESLVNTVDLPKTILNLINIKRKLIPENMQGFDITPIIKDPTQKVRNQLLIEHDEEIAKDKIFRLRTLVTASHRLTLYDGYENFGDLFDYENDPGEINNVWDKDKELKNTLTETLLREIISLRPRFPKRNAYN